MAYARVRTVVCMSAALLILSLARPVYASPELRCQGLGAKCLCSSTMDHNTWVNLGEAWWTQDEPNACADFVGGRRVNWLTTPPESVVEAGMPAGNVVDRVVRFKNPAGAMAVTISPGPRGVAPGRVCARYYMKLSSDYQSTNANVGCENDKYITLAQYIGGFETSWGGSMGGIWSSKPHDFRGKWVRIEMCVDNWSNPSRYDMWLKNISDNTSEEYSVKTKESFAAQGPATEFWVINGYRQGNCRGYRDFSYAMIALFPLNSNDRIGAAAEIEGGLSPDTAPPSTPKNLRLSSWLQEWLPLSIWSLSSYIRSGSSNAFAAPGPAIDSSCQAASRSQ